MIPYKILKHSNQLEIGDIFWYDKGLWIVTDAALMIGDNNTLSNYIEPAWHVIAHAYERLSKPFIFTQNNTCYLNAINKSIPVVGYAKIKINATTKPKITYAKHKKISRSNSEKDV